MSETEGRGRRLAVERPAARGVGGVGEDGMMLWLYQILCALRDHGGIGELWREGGHYYGRCKKCGKRVKI